MSKSPSLPSKSSISRCGCQADKHGVILGNDRRIAVVQHKGDAEDEANTNLISAAPDMLAALKAVISVADRKTDEFDAAKAAIRKATGEA